MLTFRKSKYGFFLAPNSIVVGDVLLGEDSSVWFNAVIRGDVAAIRIGKRTNVQDGVVIHCDTGEPNTIGDDVTIGHSAIIHGTSVGDGTLMGMGAKLLGRTVVGRECLIGAGAVLSPGTVVPDRSVVMGIPGRVVRPVSEKDLEYMRWLPAHYVELAKKYAGDGFRSVE